MERLSTATIDGPLNRAPWLELFSVLAPRTGPRKCGREGVRARGSEGVRVKQESSAIGALSPLRNLHMAAAQKMGGDSEG